MKQIERMTQYFLRRGMITQELAPWLAYALQHFCFSAVSYTLLFTWGALFLGALPTAAFLLAFSWLRRYIGGWHAASPLRCCFFSLLHESVCLLVLYPLFLQRPVLFSAMLCALGGAGVLRWAPLPPKGLHESGAERAALKKSSRRTLFFELLLVAALALFRFYSLALCAALGVGCAAFLLWIARLLTIRPNGGNDL